MQELNGCKDMIDKLINTGKVILIIGSVDTGKTTFVEYLAISAYNKGKKVAVVDADIGQSDIGPPTTIGWGFIEDNVKSLTEIKLRGLYFVGATSPQDYLTEQVIGTRKMVDRALQAGADFVVIDTTGLIHGELGKRLKTCKIELIEPDYVVILTYQDDEINFIPISEERIIKLTPSSYVKKKTPQFRKNKREDEFKKYFKDTTTLKLGFSEINTYKSYFLSGKILSQKELDYISNTINEIVLHGELIVSEDAFYIITADKVPPINLLKLGKKVYQKTPEDFFDTLVALLDKNYYCVSLAIIRNIDFNQKIINIISPIYVNKNKIKIIQFSNFKLKL
jgi:polynucleotide 5'-hydroxyl-kinase GRC3/NOL9